ncbi:3-hydroxyacyl-CoA dehydrogenase [Collimonas sp. OK607]|uniref:3-hydroxyacyl-CoA dehydrogenase NAD-binding domain-containing protein n=1 Tax=Collimonas sp. OK607 TaxID=1798194 RepID=UPI0008F40C4D|nr:3-hydroxyacyl-CoA dehydrogenase NAD-binding domain-containing protein [Collimonas sp. OK607]SFB21021.1 3-hydroxyacyl-CoA dehydrogenase [Collimonas sp. OK607]
MSDIETNTRVAVIALDNPPTNQLNHALNSHILEELNKAEADVNVLGIVLTGIGNTFSTGSDVAESDLSPPNGPTLRTVAARLEGYGKPVVAAIAGSALSGGLELALACHARVALASAKLGVPDIELGLIPNAGGTQRLPRLIGMSAALDLLLSGKSKTAAEMDDTGLLDTVVGDSLLDAARDKVVELAERLARGEALPRISKLQLDPQNSLALLDQQRARFSSRQKLQRASSVLLEALAGSALPFDEGMVLENKLAFGLLSGMQASALRYQTNAERDSSRLPPELKANALPLRNVAVIGAGTMGTGIAIAALDAGYSVTLLEQDSSALERGMRRVGDHYEGRVTAGKMEAAVASNALERLYPTTDWAPLSEADLIIEAVFEDLEVKRQVFSKLDTVASPGAILASNTSYLDLDAIANATSRPKDVLGLHFFSPANVMKLLEVVRGTKTSSEALATGMELGKALRKMPVLSGNAFGFIGNRIYNAYRKQCEFMLEDGAWPEDIDTALTGFGFAMGPFAVADLSGLDIAWRMRKAQAGTRDARERYVDILDRLCEKGRLGRKAGVGYYVYENGNSVETTDTTVRQIIVQARAKRGKTIQTLDAEIIRRRVLLTMVNEAALVLAEKVAARASDIDVVMVQGYGFPRWEGGPVFWARQQERDRLDADLHRLASENGFGAVCATTAMLDELLA